jgi:hypothetical protein
MKEIALKRYSSTLLLALLLLVLSLSASAGLMEDMRKNYGKAMEDKAICESLWQRILADDSPHDALYLAYKGGICMGMAKHSVLAGKRVEYLNMGKKLIDDAVRMNGQNVEIRFIRYSVQVNVPPIFGYNKNKAVDRTYIMEHLQDISNEKQRSEISAFMEKHAKK